MNKEKKLRNIFIGSVFLVCLSIVIFLILTTIFMYYFTVDKNLSVKTIYDLNIYDRASDFQEGDKFYTVNFDFFERSEIKISEININPETSNKEKKYNLENHIKIGNGIFDAKDIKQQADIYFIAFIEQELDYSFKKGYFLIGINDNDFKLYETSREIWSIELSGNNIFTLEQDGSEVFYTKRTLNFEMEKEVKIDIDYKISQKPKLVVEDNYSYVIIQNDIYKFIDDEFFEKVNLEFKKDFKAGLFASYTYETQGYDIEILSYSINEITVLQKIYDKIKIQTYNFEKNTLTTENILDKIDNTYFLSIKKVGKNYYLYYAYEKGIFHSSLRIAILNEDFEIVLRYKLKNKDLADYYLFSPTKEGCYLYAKGNLYQTNEL